MYIMHIMYMPLASTLGGARLCAATTSTLQRCRHYAARRKPQRTGRQGREGIYSPTVAG